MIRSIDCCFHPGHGPQFLNESKEKELLELISYRVSEQTIEWCKSIMDLLLHLQNS